jgi:predicted DNA-binding transcriptional regulator AlpA
MTTSADPMDTDILPVGIPEIADKLGVKRATVDQWIQRGLLPPPDWTIGGRPAWNWPTIRRWAAGTGRIVAPLDSRPLYGQLADALAEQIQRGELAPGQLLPSEPYLMGNHDVSRGTVRAAMALLRDRGLIVTAPGKGSFVAGGVEPE